jgi:hypothetical protein
MDSFGVYKLKCVKTGGVVLANYHNYPLAKDEEIDLLDQGLSVNIKFTDFNAARNACEDSGFELAQRIAAGELVVLKVEPPDDLR